MKTEFDGITLTIDDKLDLELIDETDTFDIFQLDDCYVNLSKDDYYTFILKEYPEKIAIQINSNNGFGTFLFYELLFWKESGKFKLEFTCHQPNKYWEGRWGLTTFLNAIKTQLEFNSNFQLGEIDVEDDWKKISIITELSDDLQLFSSISAIASDINAIIRQAEIYLSGIIWKKEYETDEKLFCTEILTPLLRRMGFISVSYKHGKKEYGKDYTFSEMTPFGELRHFGLQAKAGNISGKINSEVDEIIGQLNDAFSMPYIEISSSDKRYISVFIVAISGNFAENAKEKIVEKIPKGLHGSVYFFDREKIIELIERYWKK